MKYEVEILASAALVAVMVGLGACSSVESDRILANEPRAPAADSPNARQACSDRPNAAASAQPAQALAGAGREVLLILPGKVVGATGIEPVTPTMSR